VKNLTPWLLTTGDDEGVIKVDACSDVLTLLAETDSFLSIQQLWDSRQKEAVRTYTHHFDYISDFLWLEDKKQLVATRYALMILYSMFNYLFISACMFLNNPAQYLFLV
jgi:hypothetical protein